jgi:hypothetical protein
MVSQLELRRKTVDDPGVKRLPELMSEILFSGPIALTLVENYT